MTSNKLMWWKYISCIFILSIVVMSCGQKKTSSFSVLDGHFVESFRETGDLAAKRALAIPMPRMDYRYGYRFKIIDMLQNGSSVQTGDTLIKLDDASIRKFIIQTEEALETERGVAKKLKVELENALQELEAQLKSEEAKYRLNKLQLERAKFDTEQKQKIAALRFKQATMQIDKLKRQLKEKPKMAAYDLKIQDIKIWQKEQELDGALLALNNMVVVSPGEGLFQVGSSPYRYPPIDLKIGDEVRMGGLLAKIPDVNNMMVNTSINEADLTKVQVGDKVLVRLDADPKKTYAASVMHIARSCIEKEKEKVFKVKVEIDDTDLALKPGMTVSCEFICYECDDQLFVPNKCLLVEEGKAYVFLEKGGNPEKVEVERGPSNSNHTIIFSKLNAGQRIVPFEEVLNPKTT